MKLDEKRDADVKMIHRKEPEDLRVIRIDCSLPIEEQRAQLDPCSRRNMEQCAEFIAKMIRKNGRKVLNEMKAKEKDSLDDGKSLD